ncbi:LPXTG cell wall anchor domain-containing protein [Lactobacillus crispatus]|uniref:mucin-binding protein n=1 Tax=Lactobacillus crispatus TaxID=47770 RepID=UPI0030FBD767
MLKKTATRTINVTTPDGKTATVKQTATWAKRVDFGKDAHPDWTTGEWTSYDVPIIPGYTASQSNVAKEAVTGTTKDQTVNITYTANDGTQTIIYQGEDDSEIGKQVIHGKTDETVKVTPDVPDGYVVKGEVPSEVTIKPDDTPITITIEHGKSHIDPDKPVNSGEHIPGTTDKTYPSGLTHDDLNKTITREVTITDPTGKKSTTTQTVTFTRGATVDEVTNKVTYDDWSENGKHTFDKVDVPTVPGYTVSGEVPEVVVTPETQSSKVNIAYTANDGTQTIVYQDEDGSEIGKQVISGKTDEKVKVTPDVPDGYVLKGEVPSEVTIKPDDTPITVTVEHGKSHVTPDKPVNKGDLIPDTKDKHYPEGLTHNDLNKTVTREITIIDPTGKKSTTTQTVTFTRGATVDEVTNKVTYDDWSENGKHTFDKVDVPTVLGYTASGEVPSIVVTPETQSSKVDITYTANAQTATITYIDDTEKKTLGSDKQNGKFNQVITFEHDPAEVIKGLEEKGYKLVSNDFKPGIKYQNDNKSNSFEVHLVHTYEPVETSQTITETVHYIDANGKPVAPDHVATVVVKVTGTRDKVTDSITWNTPSTGHFDEVISPVVPNMTPDKKLIPSHDVQYGDSDITESVVYTPDEIPSEPEKPNDQGKPNSKTPEKPNKPCNSASKTSEKSNKSSKEVSKQFGTIAKTTIPEKLIDSRTVDNHVSAKSTAKQELPQTGATTNTGIWTGLVSMIAGLGLVGASKKRKKN